MKKIYAVILLLIAGNTYAQQDPQFTQFRENLLIINPAYAGSRGALTLAMIHRSQWVGVEGAPTTQTLTAHSPFYNNKLGIGLTLFHDKIGVSRTTGLFSDVAGRIKVGEASYLSAGLKLGFNFFQSNLSELQLDNSNDNSFLENVSSLQPNVGFGLYYYTPGFYVGLSVPRILQLKLFEEESIDGPVLQKRHFYAMSGAVFSLSSNIKFRPSALVKVVEAVPLSVDVAGSFIFNDKFWVGGYYRLSESTGLILNYNFTPQLRMGYSYDYTLTDLQTYNSGSHEISLIYDFIYNAKKIRSPRYF